MGYQLLIVEDEKAIANGIANSLPWEEWGFGICGVCSDGVEALERISESPPDVVLSDIRMPKMDGLELMQHLSQDYPKVRIVILSGYHDFAYLQTAIKNGVCEYLLKPTDIDEFEEVFRRLKGRLDEERQRQRSLEEGRKLREQEQLNALLKGYGYDEEEMDQVFCETKGRLGVLYFYMEDKNPEDKKKKYDLQRQVVELLEELRRREKLTGRFFLNFEEKIAGILLLPEGREEEERLKNSAAKMLAGVKEKTGVGLSVGISSFYLDYQMLPQCYQQAKCCAGQKIFSEQPQLILSYRELRQADFNYSMISFDADKIMSCILEADLEGLLGELEKTFSAFRNRMIPDYSYLNRMSMELMCQLSRKLLRNSVQLEKVMERVGCDYEDIYRTDSLEHQKELLFRLLAEVTKECQSMLGETKKRSSLALTIRKIVDSEYHSNEISLEYIAGKVHKNTAYISKIFKKEFDCNFSDYITQKRLERSLELLQDPALKIYEISEALGWADVSNYIKVFKRRYGMSPNEYRSSTEKNVEDRKRGNGDREEERKR
ncbi:MAG: response regulator [bacterium]|nr:response regulator [bacterium]